MRHRRIDSNALPRQDRSLSAVSLRLLAHRTFTAGDVSQRAFVGNHFRELTGDHLDTLQLVINHSTLEDILNHSESADYETYLDLVYLLEHNYIQVFAPKVKPLPDQEATTAIPAMVDMEEPES